jgi:hypothetical protein
VESLTSLLIPPFFLQNFDFITFSELTSVGFDVNKADAMVN